VIVTWASTTGFAPPFPSCLVVVFCTNPQSVRTSPRRFTRPSEKFLAPGFGKWGPFRLPSFVSQSCFCVSSACSPFDQFLGCPLPNFRFPRWKPPSPGQCVPGPVSSPLSLCRGFLGHGPLINSLSVLKLPLALSSRFASRFSNQNACPCSTPFSVPDLIPPQVFRDRMRFFFLQKTSCPVMLGAPLDKFPTCRSCPPPPTLAIFSLNQCSLCLSIAPTCVRFLDFLPEWFFWMQGISVAFF